MTDTNRPLRAFLCHASGDKPAVKKLYNRLVKDGIDAWLDKEKLIPGQNWQTEIPKAVYNSDVVIVCLSSQSVTKEGFVQKEIKFALDAADEKPDGVIFIIPARLEDCNVPERINKFHWVDLYSDHGYTKLLNALQIRADSIGATITPEKNKSVKASNKTSVQPKIIKEKRKINKPIVVAPKQETVSSNYTNSKLTVEENNNQEKSFFPIEGVCMYFSGEYLMSRKGKSLQNLADQGLIKQGTLRLSKNSFIFNSENYLLEIDFGSIKSIEVKSNPFWAIYLSKYLAINYVENNKNVLVGLIPVGTTLEKKMVSILDINRGVKDWMEFIGKIPELSEKISL